MANMFDNICSSSYSPMSHEPSDDISVLLRQILSKPSSSSSSSSLLTKQQQQPHSADVANVAVNVGAIDYDHSDEYDCESQVLFYTFPYFEFVILLLFRVFCSHFFCY